MPPPKQAYKICFIFLIVLSVWRIFSSPVRRCKQSCEGELWLLYLQQLLPLVRASLGQYLVLDLFIWWLCLTNSSVQEGEGALLPQEQPCGNQKSNQNKEQLYNQASQSLH